VNRRLLLTAAEHLSARQWNPLTRILDDHDPTNEIGAAWAVRERLRRCCSPSTSHRRFGGGWPISMMPRSTPGCPRPPGSPRPCATSRATSSSRTLSRRCQRPGDQ
jgi:hypothetical protein